jgi:DNA-binding NarL/FixJ family response regulator
VLTATRAAEPGSVDRSGTPDSRRRQIRLMVVDDHTAVRLGVAQLLAGQDDFAVQLVCIDAEDAVWPTTAPDIDVAVIDYHLGGRNGLWLCRRLKRLAEPPGVIIYSAFANDHLAACCSVAGADGVLNEAGLGSELCDAVRSVAAGGRSLPRALHPIVDMLRRRLSDSEQQLFGMPMAGIPAVEITHALGMSARELDSREAAMLRKLEVTPGAASAPGRDDVEHLIP